MEEKRDIEFKIRFNTQHKDTDLYWRVIVNDEENLVRTIKCNVNTYTESSFDKLSGMIKFHIAGFCEQICIDENLNAVII